MARVPAEGVTLSGIHKDKTDHKCNSHTEAVIRELWRNPQGCRRCKAQAESLRQKDRERNAPNRFVR